MSVWRTITDMLGITEPAQPDPTPLEALILEAAVTLDRPRRCITGHKVSDYAVPLDDSGTEWVCVECARWRPHLAFRLSELPGDELAVWIGDHVVGTVEPVAYRCWMARLPARDVTGFTDGRESALRALAAMWQEAE